MNIGRCARIAPLAVMIAGVFTGQPARADDLANRSFQLQFDASGISSLRRTNDVHDTDYITSNGRLGRLIVRYRTTARGDWRELRELAFGPRRETRDTIEYLLGTLSPTLASKSSATAVTGAGGLRALNDGLVPAATGGGRGGPPPAPSAPPPPLFTWSGARGAVQWVQYTFPNDEDVSQVEVFWAGSESGVGPPRSWRLLYQENGGWKEVAPTSGAYPVEPNRFTRVTFAPVRTIAMRIEVTLASDATVGLAEWRVGADPAFTRASDLAASEAFTLGTDALDWRITLHNATTRRVEIGDIAVPLPMAERTGARGDIYTRKLLRHAFIAGHGSWVYWQRSGGDGPYLVMTPLEQTTFEYAENGAAAYTPYIHAEAAGAAVRAKGGRWRLPVTARELPPGDTLVYAFRFQWARDFSAVRDVLVKEQKFDIAVVPGMVVPSDLSALVSLRSLNRIASIDAEHPDATRIESLGTKANNASVYRVRFSRLGENTLTVKYGSGQWTTLEFFVTEPLETVIAKRAAFLATHQQHIDPGKWYAGAYGDWDQRNEILRSPEDRDGLSTWLVDSNDDAGNARPAFIASKNVFFPDRREIASLELYIDKYLWGGMQMTDREKYPYAIYGIPNWKANRASADEGRNGRAHVWRIYDYPHIILLYYRMYQIAKFYPDTVKSLDAPQYLERAYRTALAYWTVPLEVERWSADAVGTMNEAFIPELIASLEEEGKSEWARTLRGHWEGKVERFVMRTPNLYGSEFAFDSTGFESTGAFAHYAMTSEGEFRQRVTKDAAQRFMDFQLLLNMSDRGWLETTYYQLGSDYRGNLSYLLSYMSQMGGWSILDYALHFAADPTDTLRLGYASSLSSWALVNSGPESAGYGYWFPGRANDGATGGGFMADALGRGWIGKEMPRGAWYYSAEEDVGYCAALRTHATIVARDPIFGEIAYGGVLTRQGTRISVIPRDGLRVRFHVVRDAQRLHLTLDHDGFAKEQPIVVADDLSTIRFRLENRAGGAHQTALTISGLPAGAYDVAADGRRVATVQGGAAERKIALPIGERSTTDITITRQ